MFCWTNYRCRAHNPDCSSFIDDFAKKYATEIACLCTTSRFGSYVYAVFYTVFGLILNLVDMCRTITNGALPVCKARLKYEHGDWFVCPRVERDINLLGTFLNLIMYVVLLLGLLTGTPELLLPWLAYKLFILPSLLFLYLLRLAFFRVLPSKWEILIFAYNIFNVAQIMCMLFDFLRFDHKE